MARYIDAEVLVRRLKHSPLFWGTHMQFKDAVVDLVERQSTADVAPRAEVAREIFESIEECIYLYYNKNDYTMPNIEEDIAKFKKKYLEGDA